MTGRAPASVPSSDTSWVASGKQALGKLRGPAWALVDQCVVSAANFITIYLFARQLGAAAFGVLMLAYTGLQLLTSMQNALLIQPHNVLGANLALPDYRRFTGALTVVQAIVCVSVCAALGTAGMVVARFSPSAGWVMIVLALAAVPWMAQEFVRRVLYTRGETRSAALNDSVSYGLQLVGAVALVFLFPQHASAGAALAVLGASSLIAALFGLWQLRSHFSFGHGTLRTFAQTCRDTWAFGKWLTAQNGLLWVGTQGDLWVVAALLGPAEVGLYRSATHLINVMNPLRQAAYAYLPARGSLARGTTGIAGLARWVTQTQWLLIGALAPFAVVLIGAPERVLSIAYGERYAGTNMALILALATIAQCITFVKFPYDVGLLALRATRSIFRVYLIPVALLFTLGVTLISLFGVLGVPLSSMASSAALLIATRLAYLRQMKHGEGVGSASQ